MRWCTIYSKAKNHPRNLATNQKHNKKRSRISRNKSNVIFKGQPHRQALATHKWKIINGEEISIFQCSFLSSSEACFQQTTAAKSSQAAPKIIQFIQISISLQTPRYYYAERWTKSRNLIQDYLDSFTHNVLSNH